MKKTLTPLVVAFALLATACGGGGLSEDDRNAISQIARQRCEAAGGDAGAVDFGTYAGDERDYYNRQVDVQCASVVRQAERDADDEPAAASVDPALTQAANLFENATLADRAINEPERVRSLAGSICDLIDTGIEAGVTLPILIEGAWNEPGTQSLYASNTPAQFAYDFGVLAGIGDCTEEMLSIS